MTHRSYPIAIWGVTGIILIFCFWFVTPGHATVNPSMKKSSKSEVGKVPKKQVRLIDLEEYEIKLYHVSMGQTLSSIMANQGIDHKIIYTASQKAKDIFKIDEMQSGVPYVVAKQTEFPFNTQYLILNIVPDRSVVFEFENYLDVFWGKIKTKKHTKRVTGTIRSSFWKTMERHEIERKHILQLMTLFNSRIQFDKMRTQDGFGITFEEHKTNNTVIQTGEILSVIMDIKGKKISAFRFEHHGLVSYYDETGRNLSSAFLESPVRYKKITSIFSDRRAHPILKKPKKHPATDFGAPEGSPVMSIGDGVIEKAGYSNTAGNFIKIAHANSYKSHYLHLIGFADSIQNGLQIKKGNVIGYVGSTGIATGPHLDFRISKNGQFIDFLNDDLPEGKPVDDDCFETFIKIVKKYTKELKTQTNT